jgi:hypothetical protein
MLAGVGAAVGGNTPAGFALIALNLLAFDAADAAALGAAAAA